MSVASAAQFCKPMVARDAHDSYVGLQNFTKSVIQIQLFRISLT